jgi:S1-C subfamily serine protease
VSGTRHTHIVAASALDGMLECTYDEQPALRFFSQISAFLSEISGPAGGSLLALPERAFSKARKSEMITWYADRPGPFRPLSALPAEQQAAAEAALRAILEKALPIADGQIRDMLAVALNIADPDGMLFDGETVVLVKWGLRKSVDGADPANTEPFLSRYLPGGFAILPALAPSIPAADKDREKDPSANSADEGREPVVGGATQTPAASFAKPAAANDGSASTAHAADRNQAAAPASATKTMAYSGHITATWWLTGITGALVVFLLYLLWPGNLVYQVRSAFGSQAVDPAMDGLQAQVDDSLRSQIRELQSGLRGDLCAAPNLDRLDGISNLPLLPETPWRTDGASTIPRPSEPSFPAQHGRPTQPGAGEPSPAATPTTGEQTTALPAANLLANLEAGTVIVVGSTSSRETSIGSGFFVSPRHILTNGHVVAGVQAGTVFVANKAIGSPIAAKVMASTTARQGSGDDFALLELERDASRFQLPFTNTIDRLDSVVAGGYPSFVVDRDPNFYQAFSQGEWRHLGDIQLTVSRGEVTAKQSGETGATVLAHSATISPGSSGGPLVDRCGRIVGVNTYIRTDQVSFARLNYAQSASDAIRFLAANHISVPTAGSACGDALAAPAPQAPQAALRQPAGSPATTQSAGPTVPSDPAPAAGAQP